MDPSFTAEKISRTAVIRLQAGIETVFPLFGAFEERKWVNGWNPQLVYPDTEKMEVLTSFTTKGKTDTEDEYLWRVIRYEPERHFVQYLISTENRYWTITVECRPETENFCTAAVTYTFIGLNQIGNKLNQAALDAMFAQNLEDWSRAIHHYLATGTVLS